MTALSPAQSPPLVNTPIVFAEATSAPHRHYPTLLGDDATRLVIWPFNSPEGCANCEAATSGFPAKCLRSTLTCGESDDIGSRNQAIVLQIRPASLRLWPKTSPERGMD
jgi:hypothetical protein